MKTQKPKTVAPYSQIDGPGQPRGESSPAGKGAQPRYAAGCRGAAAFGARGELEVLSQTVGGTQTAVEMRKSSRMENSPPKPEVIRLQPRPPYELEPEQFAALQWESFGPSPRSPKARSALGQDQGGLLRPGPD